MIHAKSSSFGQTPPGDYSNHADGPTSLPRDEITLPVRKGLLELLQACTYATDLSQDVWSFATEIGRLRQHGISNNDLRWMIGKKWLEHAHETTRPDDNSRSFQASGVLTFSTRSCFVLSASGLVVAKELWERCRPPSEIAADDSGSSGQPGITLNVKPRWDPERNRLYYGEVLVKEFKLPSPNQTTILMAFEEEQWSPRIDDPLPGSPDVEAKERLRFTIKSLNRHQRQNVIRFSGDGSGKGIRWEPRRNGDAFSSGPDEAVYAPGPLGRRGGMSSRSPSR